MDIQKRKKEIHLQEDVFGGEKFSSVSGVIELMLAMPMEELKIPPTKRFQ